MIGQKGIPSRGGGVEKHVEELSTRLVKLGNDVSVYTRPNYTDKNLKEYKGVKLISLPSIGTKNLDAISHTFLACFDAIFRRKVDIIHFHAIGPSSLIWLVKIFKPGTRIVSTFHCQDYFHKKWSFPARFYLRFGEFVTCKVPDKTITVSENLKKYAEAKFKKQMFYIPNGVNVSEKLEADLIKKEWGLEKDGYILTVSRLVKHKGAHHLIKAYNKINTDKKLVVVGDGAYTDDYVREIKSLAKDNSKIIFTGRQTGKILMELFSNAYIFVQPSEYEGLSIALLEAMSFGLPVLSSDIPENLEPLHGAGIIFKNQDYNDLKDKLEKSLYNEEKVKFLGNRAKSIVEKYYNLENIAKETNQLYTSLLK